MRFFDFVPCSLPLKTLILLTFSCFLIRRRGMPLGFFCICTSDLKHSSVQMRIKEPEERGECSKNKLAAAKHCEKAERITDPLCHGLPNMICVLSRRNERCGKIPAKGQDLRFCETVTAAFQHLSHHPSRAAAFPFPTAWRGSRSPYRTDPLS